MYNEIDISTWTVEDFNRNLAEVHALFDAPEGSPEAARLDVIMPLVADYDDAHYPIGTSSGEDALDLEATKLEVGELIPA